MLHKINSKWIKVKYMAEYSKTLREKHRILSEINCSKILSDPFLRVMKMKITQDQN